MKQVFVFVHHILGDYIKKFNRILTVNLGGSRISQTGRRQPKMGGTYYLAKFRQKLHENEENWTEGGGTASKILLCRSAPGKVGKKLTWDLSLNVTDRILVSLLGLINWIIQLPIKSFLNEN